MMKWAIFFLIFVLVISPVSAFDEDEDDDNNGIILPACLLNLDDCIIDALHGFIAGLFNAPLLPTLALIKTLITSEISIGEMHAVWSIVRYILSAFYVLFFAYAGFMFMFAEGSPIKRAKAKKMLQNCVIMLVLIQSSFLIYEFLLEFSHGFTMYFFEKIPQDIFQITLDGWMNGALEIMYGSLYLFIVSITLLLVVIRYVVAFLGVAFFPIGIMCYFFPPLRAYGKYIIKSLLLFMFVICLDMLFLYGVSLLLAIPPFNSAKIILMMGAFCIVNYSIYFAIKYTFKVDVSSIKDDIVEAAQYAALAA